MWMLKRGGEAGIELYGARLYEADAEVLAFANVILKEHYIV